MNQARMLTPNKSTPVYSYGGCPFLGLGHQTTLKGPAPPYKIDWGGELRAFAESVQLGMWRFRDKPSIRQAAGNRGVSLFLGIGAPKWCSSWCPAKPTKKEEYPQKKTDPIRIESDPSSDLRFIKPQKDTPHIRQQTIASLLSVGFSCRCLSGESHRAWVISPEVQNQGRPHISLKQPWYKFISLN